MTAGTVVPEKVGERLIKALATLLATITHALDSGAPAPSQAAHWAQAKTLLESYLIAGREAARVMREGQTQPMVGLASRLRFLGRDMDGYRLDFAGAEMAQRIEDERRLVVFAAWQVYQPGSGAGE